MNSKAIKRQLLAAIAMVLVAALALGSSTYAWFVNNTRVTAGTFSATATTSNALEISNDGTTWLTSIDLSSDSVGSWAPVSTTDLVLFAKDKTWNTSANNKGNVVTVWEDATANTHYYAKTFYLRANQDCTVQLNVGTKVKETTATPNGILNAMRIGFASGTETVVYQISDSTKTEAASRRDTTEFTEAVDGIAKAIKVTAGTPDNSYAVENTAFTRTATITTNGSTGDTTASGAIIERSTDNSTLGTATANNYIVHLTANTSTPVTLYIWLEGCDYDCVSSIAAGSIQTSLEFQACTRLV